MEKRQQEETRRQQIERDVLRELGFSRLLWWRTRRLLGALAVWAAFLVMALVLYLAYRAWMAPHPEPTAGAVESPAR